MAPVYTRERRALHGVDQVGEDAAEAVELPDDEHVARPERAHAAVESRAVVVTERRSRVGVNAGRNCSFVAPENCTYSDSDEVTSLRSSSPPSAGDGSVWTPSRRVRGD